MRKQFSGITLIPVLLIILALAFNVHPIISENDLDKILVFEESFEGEIAAWWNEIRGTPTLTTVIAHSGNYSYVIDEDEDGLIYWFDSSIINEIWEFEVWFYDNMSGLPVTSIIGTGWAPSQVLGILIWYGGDYEHFYAYRYGFDLHLSTFPRSKGWHRVNIVHEPEKATLLLDGDVLFQTSDPVSFNRFFVGDYWLESTFSYTYYDNIKVWKSVVPVEHSFLTIETTVGGTTDPPPGTYGYTVNSLVQVTAIPDTNYLFDYWELDGVNASSANPCSVLLDKNHTLKAVFASVPSPFSVFISPSSGLIKVGHSLTFISGVTGGAPPYGYQWYLNETTVSGATSINWTFTPTTSGIYYIYLKVTDAEGNTTPSETACVRVRESYEIDTITIEAVADAYVRSTTKSSGTDTSLEVSYLYGTMSITFILFDLSVIPPGAQIDSVVLKLKVNVFVPEWNKWISVFGTSAEWSENEINWNNKPHLNKLLATQRISLLDVWHSWKDPYLTNAVEEALNQKENLSLALKSYFLSDLTGLVVFFSRESGNAPRLEITYMPDTTPPSISNIKMQPSAPTPDDEITFSMNINDDLSGVKEAYLYYSVDNGSSWNKIGIIFSGGAYKATIPKQAEGTTIQYYFEAFDNAYNRAQSDIYSYTVRYGIPLYLYLFLLLIFSVIVIFLIYHAKRKGAFSTKPKQT